MATPDSGQDHDHDHAAPISVVVGQGNPSGRPKEETDHQLTAPSQSPHHVDKGVDPNSDIIAELQHRIRNLSLGSPVLNCNSQLQSFVGSELEARVLSAQDRVLESSAQVQDYFQSALLSAIDNSNPVDGSGLNLPLDQTPAIPVQLSYVRANPTGEVKDLNSEQAIQSATILSPNSGSCETREHQTEDIDKATPVAFTDISSSSKTSKTKTKVRERPDYGRFLGKDDLYVPNSIWSLARNMGPDSGDWNADEMDHPMYDMAYPPIFDTGITPSYPNEPSKAELMTAQELNVELDRFYGPDPPENAAATLAIALAAHEKVQNARFDALSAGESNGTIQGDSLASQATGSTSFVRQGDPAASSSSAEIGNMAPDDSEVSQMLASMDLLLSKDKGGANVSEISSPNTHETGFDEAFPNVDINACEKLLEKTNEDTEFEEAAVHRYLTRDGKYGFSDFLPNEAIAASSSKLPLNIFAPETLDVANNSGSFQRMMDKLWSTYEDDSNKHKSPGQRAAELRQILEEGNATDTAKKRAPSPPSKRSKQPVAVDMNLAVYFKQYRDERDRQLALVDKMVGPIGGKKPIREEAVKNTNGLNKSLGELDVSSTQPENLDKSPSNGKRAKKPKKTKDVFIAVAAKKHDG